MNKQKIDQILFFEEEKKAQQNKQANKSKIQNQNKKDNPKQKQSNQKKRRHYMIQKSAISCIAVGKVSLPPLV